jgi:predicted secreted hydrolase
VSDFQDEKFLVDDKLGRGAMGIGGVSLDGPRVRVFLHGWQAVVEGRGHHLQADSGGFGINLELVSKKPPVGHGESGLSRKGAATGQASYYYSLTRMECQGSIRIGENTLEVSGLGWMDHEFTSNVLSKDQVGWDWIGLQFSDGRELMLYVLRHRDGSADPFSSGTLVQADGTPVHLQKEAFVIEPMGYWHSTKSNARYPSSWRVEVFPYNLSLRVVPGLKDQELITRQSTQVTYWEGSVEVTGKAAERKLTGAGYVELTGYAEAFDPAFRGF